MHMNMNMFEHSGKDFMAFRAADKIQVHSLDKENMQFSGLF